MWCYWSRQLAALPSIGRVASIHVLCESNAVPCYIIAYDLHQGEADAYESLIAVIKSFGIWARITESTWAVVSDLKATAVRDLLLASMKDKDRLFVVKSGVEAAWHNTRCKNDWLKKHL